MSTEKVLSIPYSDFDKAVTAVQGRLEGNHKKVVITRGNDVLGEDRGWRLRQKQSELVILANFVQQILDGKEVTMSMLPEGVAVALLNALGQDTSQEEKGFYTNIIMAVEEEKS